MKLEKIQESIKELTPDEKLKFIQPLLKKERSRKNKEALQKLVSSVKEEQLLLEEGIRKLTTKKREEQKEEPLENIVEEEAEKIGKEKIQEQQLRIYATQEQKKPAQLYGRAEEAIKLYGTQSPHEMIYTSENYIPPHQEQENRFTREERLINPEEHRLKKERKKYETGN